MVGLFLPLEMKVQI